MPNMVEQKSFYVGISNKSDIRREILECSKDIVGILKGYDKVNSIREEKIEKIFELKNVLAEIKQLNNSLKEKFPSEKPKEKKNIKKAYAKKVEKPKFVKMAPIKHIVKKPSSEIKKLEEELSEIEDRLSKMGA